MIHKNLWHPQSSVLYDYDPKRKEHNALVMSLIALARCQSMFDYQNLPDTIPRRDLEMLIMSAGCCAITKVEGELYALWGGLGGEPNPYYMPTIFTVSNPALKYSANLKIGIECEIVPNDSVYMGLLPIICKSSYLRAENDLSLYINDINSRIVAAITANTDREESSAKQFLHDIKDGNLGVLMSDVFSEGLKSLPYASSGRSNAVTQLLEYQQYLRATLYNELGLNANFNMKRAQLSEGEVDVNREALLPFVDDMKRTRIEAYERVNRMYGTSIKVDFYSSWQIAEEIMDGMGESNAQTNLNGNNE